MSIYKERGRWRVHVEFERADGERVRVRKVAPVQTRRGAEEYERQLRTALLDGRRTARKEEAPCVETVREYAKRWIRWRTSAGMSSAPEHAAELRRTLQVIGTRKMASVTEDDMRQVVRALDAAARQGVISPKTAINDWATAKAMFRDASGGTKEITLVIEGMINPTAGVLAPDSGVDRDRLYLYPQDALELFACADIPLARRRLYAVAMYTALRAGELHALTWGDLDFVGGQIRVNKAEDRVRSPGKVKPTKTKKARRVPIERELRPLLEAMQREARHARVFPEGVNNRASEMLKRDLRTAGVGARRPELVTASETVDDLSFHDLRGTAATWWLLRGDSPRNVKKRTGHSTYAMLDRYDHERGEDGDGGFFPPLTVLLEDRSEDAWTTAPADAPEGQRPPDAHTPTLH